MWTPVALNVLSDSFGAETRLILCFNNHTIAVLPNNGRELSAWVSDRKISWLIFPEKNYPANPTGVNNTTTIGRHMQHQSYQKLTKQAVVFSHKFFSHDRDSAGIKKKKLQKRPSP